MSENYAIKSIEESIKIVRSEDPVTEQNYAESYIRVMLDHYENIPNGKYTLFTKILTFFATNKQDYNYSEAQKNTLMTLAVLVGKKLGYNVMVTLRLIFNYKNTKEK